MGKPPFVERKPPYEEEKRRQVKVVEVFIIIT